MDLQVLRKVSDMEQKKDMSLINCIATSMLAFFFSVPVHELFHLLTSYAYGDKCAWYSAGAVQPMDLIDYMSLSPFNRIMVAGGSASIINAIIGIILLIVLLKAKDMGPMLRLFLTQLMGAHLTLGFGYFMIGGFFATGDWHLVFKYFADSPGTVTAMRIVLSIIGSAGVVFLFFVLNYMSYYFIENNADKKERFDVASKLHLTMFILSVIVGILSMIKSPAIDSGELSFGTSLFYDMMWIPFFWGFMFTWVMVKPPKESRFLYKLPSKPNWVLFAAGIVLICIDIFVFGPGIQLN